MNKRNRTIIHTFFYYRKISTDALKGPISITAGETRGKVDAEIISPDRG